MPVEDEYRHRSRLYGTAVPAYSDPSLLLLMMEDLVPLEGVPALDLGAGHGDASFPLRRAGAQVTAVDLSPEMLEEGVRRGKIDPGRWVALDLRAGLLPFADGSFRIALTRFSLHDIPDPAPLLTEVRRVVASHGLFQIVDMSLPGRRGLALYNAIHRRKAISGELPCWIRDVPSLRRLLRGHGFEVQQEHWYESVIDSQQWLAEGQVDEDGHAHLVAYAAKAARANPGAAAALGLTVGGGRLFARFPVVVMTSRRKEENP